MHLKDTEPASVISVLQMYNLCKSAFRSTDFVILAYISEWIDLLPNLKNQVLI